MRHTALAFATASCLLWLGMVLAISFLEAPLKFRAPGVSLQVGLSIGRVVFRALNRIEVVLAAVLVVSCAGVTRNTAPLTLAACTAAVLGVQLAAVRPALSHRSDRVLAGETSARSHAHHAYIGLETVKTGLLVATAILLLLH